MYKSIVPPACIVPENIKIWHAARTLKLRLVLVKHTNSIGGEMCDVMNNVCEKPSVSKNVQYIMAEL